MGPTVGATTFGDNVMRFDVRFRTPTQEIHPKLWPGQTQAVPTGFESLTGYMPATLSVRYRYEPNGTLTAMTGVNIRYSTCPIVFSNTSGSHAMAILDRQVVQTNSLSSGYHGGWTVFSGVFKWASSHNVSGTVSAGSTYGPYENYVVIGSLNHVRSGLAQLWSALGFSSSLACATQ